VFTKVRHWTLSWASRIQFTLLILISVRSMLETPNIPSSKSHVLSPLLRLCQRISPGPRRFETFRNNKKFLRWGIVSPTPNPQAGGPPFLGCPRDCLVNIFAATLRIWRTSPHPQLYLYFYLYLLRLRQFSKIRKVAEIVNRPSSKYKQHLKEILAVQRNLLGHRVPGYPDGIWSVSGASLLVL
jgi:hypothetical protein